jgi:hypothetical protein
VSHGKMSGAIHFALNFLWLLSLLQGKESDTEYSESVLACASLQKSLNIRLLCFIRQELITGDF